MRLSKAPRSTCRRRSSCSSSRARAPRRRSTPCTRRPGASRPSPSRSCSASTRSPCSRRCWSSGSLSDYVGRRPVLIVATLVQAVTMVDLRDGRTACGALVAGARGAGPRDRRGGRRGRRGHARHRSRQRHHRQRGRADARAPRPAACSRACWSSTCPRRPSWSTVVLGAIFVAQAIGVALMPESVDAAAGRARVAAPALRLPAALRAPHAVAAPALVAHLGAGRVLRLARPDARAPARRARRSLRSAASSLFVLAAAARSRCC